MSKKFLTIFSSLFLVGILLISCSNADKTGSGDSGNGGSSGTGDSTVDTSKGIEQFNGNTYLSSSKVIIGGAAGNFWAFIKDGKVAFILTRDGDSDPTADSQNYFPVTGSGTDYSFSYGEDPYLIEGTLKFSSDGSTVTFRFTKYGATTDLENKDIVCNKK